MQVVSLLVAILLAATSLAVAAPTPAVGADLQAAAAPASNAHAAGAHIALTRRGGRSGGLGSRPRGGLNGRNLLKDRMVVMGDTICRNDVLEERESGVGECEAIRFLSQFIVILAML
ncbi:hypothetical protein DFJ73DRAFT_768365 [Zopfochytrium polystomum]|nr:hypothetical protein DFJ73DRAFT_768365 [Zopfochytrium polystomum]